MIEVRVAKAWVVAAICVPLVLGGHACARVSQLDMEEEPAETAVELVTSPTIGPGGDGTEKLAPELTGIAGWINSEPLTLAGLRGSVVLIDFWTYTCVNCIRTLQYLKDWDDRYSSAGLVIIGVHTPEFEFEKSSEHVATAVESFEIRYPVAQDNDSMTWNAFGNKVWPGKYLIDGNGYIRYTHLGEGAYSETERNIRDLLFEGGVDLGNFPDVAAPGPRLDPAAMTTLSEEGLTRELYAGYDRNRTAMSSGNSPPYFLHLEYYEFPDMDLMYEDIGERQNHYMALHGLWRNEPESIVHGRATQDYEDYIVLLFAATSVNAVMEQWAGNPYTVRVLLDGAPLRPDEAGADVKFDQEGNSYVHVTSPRMYRLVDLDRFGKHELKLSSNSYEFSLFSLTFGAYEGGEPE